MLYELFVAVGVLLALLLLVAAGAVIYVARHSDYTVVQSALWLIAKVLVRTLWRTRVENRLPRLDGCGGVVICNHRSSVDPFFVQTSVYRVIHWMVAKEYFRLPFVGWFLRQATAIPVNRGGIDTASTRSAIRLVSEGGLVGMFPEGRINQTDKLMQSVRPGAILVALKGHGKILPCYIEGAPFKETVWSPFFMRARVRVRFGEPIDLSPYFGQEKDAQLVRRLLIQAVQAIARLAGQEDFQVEVAGRRWKPDEDQ